MTAVERGLPRRRPAGRPREERADRAILAATRELIAELGLRGFRIEEVAERAEVGKAAIYRRYRSKDELVHAAVAGIVGEVPIPDTGSTSGDLRALMREAVAIYGDPVAAGLMPSVVEGLRRRPALARAVRKGFLARRRGALRTVLERGITRGDLDPGLDLEFALDVLGGPLFYRLLVTGGPIDNTLADNVVELVLRGFAATDSKQANPKQKEEKR